MFHGRDSTLVEITESTGVVAARQRLLYGPRMAMGSRIRDALDERGISQAELARKANVDEATISALIKRDSARSEYAPTIARALNVSLEWLLTGRGSSGLSRVSEANVESYPVRGARLPLISWVSAGLKDEANDPYAPGNAEAWIDFDSDASSSAFCLRVRGDSMMSVDGKEPTFPDGCIIAVEPKRRVKSREFAVFRFNDTDEATFKMYVQDGPLKLLKPLNPSYPHIVLGPDAQLVGTVFEKRIISRY
jgi:SOS-response transcriptional repressor LexA